MFLLLFLDASMAFDKLHHCKLFYKLLKIRIPVYIIRILWYWYRHQLVGVRWNNKMSEYFKVTNGVKQGGYYLQCYIMYMLMTYPVN